MHSAPGSSEGCLLPVSAGRMLPLSLGTAAQFTKNKLKMFEIRCVDLASPASLLSPGSCGPGQPLRGHRKVVFSCTIAILEYKLWALKYPG